MKIPTTGLEKISTNHICNKNYYSENINSQNSIVKNKPNNSIGKWTKDTDILPKIYKWQISTWKHVQ
jgi:hypothetical protein